MTITPTSAPGLINPNLLSGLYQAQGIPALNLTQIDKFEPVQEFSDSAGGSWRLVKDARSGMNEIPDPQSITVTDYWNHDVPGTNSKIFLYVVEGVRQPKTAREAPCRILYAWFSTSNVPTFTPQMIRPQEWLTANVYAAPMADARISKLQALTRGAVQQPQPAQPQDPQQTPLISMEELQHDIIPASAPGADAPSHPRECGKNNR